MPPLPSDFGDDSLNRVNYQDGLFMTQREFNRDQNYFLSHRHLHNANLHGWGLASVNEFPRDQFARSGDNLIIPPGVFLDSDGREIVILSNFTHAVNPTVWNAAFYVKLAYISIEVDDPSGQVSSLGTPPYPVDFSKKEIKRDTFEVTTPSTAPDNNGYIIKWTGTDFVVDQRRTIGLIEEKIDEVPTAIADQLAAFVGGSNGLKNSGVKVNDGLVSTGAVWTSQKIMQVINSGAFGTDKMDRRPETPSNEDNIVVFAADGNSKDSGIKITDVWTTPGGTNPGPNQGVPADVARLKQLGRYAMGWGIAHPKAFEAAVSGSNLVIQPGVAIDKSGNLINSTSVITVPLTSLGTVSNRDRVVLSFNAAGNTYTLTKKPATGGDAADYEADIILGAFNTSGGTVIKEYDDSDSPVRLLRRYIESDAFRLGIQEKYLNFVGNLDGQVVVPNEFVLYSLFHIRAYLRTAPSSTFTVKVRKFAAGGTTPSDVATLVFNASQNVPTRPANVTFASGTEHTFGRDDVVFLAVAAGSGGTNAENLSVSLTTFPKLMPPP